MNRLLKFTSIVLIHAFFAMQAQWAYCGEIKFDLASANNSTLSPQLNISNISYVFNAGHNKNNIISSAAYFLDGSNARFPLSYIIQEEYLFDLFCSVAENHGIKPRSKGMKELFGHSLRTANLAGFLSKQLGMDENAQEIISAVCLLHDIGKLADKKVFELTNLPRFLTREEHQYVNQHGALGVEAVNSQGIYFHEILEKIISNLHDYEKLSAELKSYAEKNPQVQLIAEIVLAADYIDAIGDKTRQYNENNNRSFSISVKEFEREYQYRVNKDIFDALHKIEEQIKQAGLINRIEQRFGKYNASNFLISLFGAVVAFGGISISEGRFYVLGLVLTLMGSLLVLKHFKAVHFIQNMLKKARLLHGLKGSFFSLFWLLLFKGEVAFKLRNGNRVFFKSKQVFLNSLSQEQRVEFEELAVPVFKYGKNTIVVDLERFNKDIIKSELFQIYANSDSAVAAAIGQWFGLKIFGKIDLTYYKDTYAVVNSLFKNGINKFSFADAVCTGIAALAIISILGLFLIGKIIVSSIDGSVIVPQYKERPQPAPKAPDIFERKLIIPLEKFEDSKNLEEYKEAQKVLLSQIVEAINQLNLSDVELPLEFPFFSINEKRKINFHITENLNELLEISERWFFADIKRAQAAEKIMASLIENQAFWLEARTVGMDKNKNITDVLKLAGGYVANIHFTSGDGFSGSAVITEAGLKQIETGADAFPVLPSAPGCKNNVSTENINGAAFLLLAGLQVYLSKKKNGFLENDLVERAI